MARSKPTCTNNPHPNSATQLNPQQEREPTHIELPFGLEVPFHELGDLLLGEGLPEYVLPGHRLVPRLHTGEERPRWLHGLHTLLARWWQHERIKLRKLLAALWQRLPSRPRAWRGLGPERQERGLTERYGACAWGLSVAILKLEWRTIEAVREATIGDADSGGGLIGVRDGNLLGTTPRGCREGRMRSDSALAALGAGGRLLVVGEAEAEGGGKPWMGLLSRRQEGARGQGGSRHGCLPRKGDGGHMCYLLPFRSRDKAARIIF